MRCGNLIVPETMFGQQNRLVDSAATKKVPSAKRWNRWLRFLRKCGTLHEMEPTIRREGCYGRNWRRLVVQPTVLTVVSVVVGYLGEVGAAL